MTAETPQNTTSSESFYDVQELPAFRSSASSGSYESLDDTNPFKFDTDRKEKEVGRLNTCTWFYLYMITSQRFEFNNSARYLFSSDNYRIRLLRIKYI